VRLSCFMFFILFNIHVPTLCVLVGLCASVGRRSLCMLNHLHDLLFTLLPNLEMLKLFTEWNMYMPYTQMRSMYIELAIAKWSGKMIISAPFLGGPFSIHLYKAFSLGDRFILTNHF